MQFAQRIVTYVNLVALITAYVTFLLDGLQGHPTRWQQAIPYSPLLIVPCVFVIQIHWPRFSKTRFRTIVMSTEEYNTGSKSLAYGLVNMQIATFFRGLNYIHVNCAHMGKENTSLWAYSGVIGIFWTHISHSFNLIFDLKGKRSTVDLLWSWGLLFILVHFNVLP